VGRFNPLGSGDSGSPAAKIVEPREAVPMRPIAAELEQPRSIAAAGGETVIDSQPLTAGADSATPSRLDPRAAIEPDERGLTRSQPSDAVNESDARSNEESVVDDDSVRVVPVHYVTDRAEYEPPPITVDRLFLPGGLIVLAVVASGIAWKTRRVPLVLVACAAWMGTAATAAPVAIEACRPPAELVDYGNHRGAVQYGLCEVTIPPEHTAGVVEAPNVLKLEFHENEEKHVTLRSVTPLAADQFYQSLQTQIGDTGQVLVFVHGYNVNFADAVRRTAQMAFDLEFAGAAVCYSWPSQGGLFQYTVDENNVTWTTPHLQQVLLELGERFRGRPIHLVAHSMGNRALTSALKEIETDLAEQQTKFHQIVLAAPDVDADIFRRDIAPAIVNTAHRVTLYASSNDQALVASRKVHGHPRAGDSGAALVVAPGIETIDVSGVDTSYLGHSYYASNESILRDLRAVLVQTHPASMRPWLAPRIHHGAPFWVYPMTEQARRQSDDSLKSF
jgi:esterase/lipase superfamily enzyme